MTIFSTTRAWRSVRRRPLKLPTGDGSFQPEPAQRVRRRKHRSRRAPCAEPTGKRLSSRWRSRRAPAPLRVPRHRRRRMRWSRARTKLQRDVASRSCWPAPDPERLAFGARARSRHSITRTSPRSRHRSHAPDGARRRRGPLGIRSRPVPIVDVRSGSRADCDAPRRRTRAGASTTAIQASEHQGARSRHGEGVRLRLRAMTCRLSVDHAVAETAHATAMGVPARPLTWPPARGRLSTRADLWAFGVAYEMPIGARAFAGTRSRTSWPGWREGAARLAGCGTPPLRRLPSGARGCEAPPS